MKNGRILNLIKNPIGIAKRELRRYLRKYKYQKIYAKTSENYWSDRLGKYKFDLRGVGDEGISDAQNKEVYEHGKNVFLDLCRNEKIDFTKIKVLDIGCGAGFYTELFFSKGTKDYLGIDITDALFEDLRQKYVNYRFQKLDVSAEDLGDFFDLIIMIDVTQHITVADKFSFAMQNIKSHLSERGIFIVTSSLTKDAQLSYYEVTRSLDTYKREFHDFVFSTPTPFRDKFIFTIRK